MPRAVVVIPARWGSARFPGKVLAPLAGKPLVLHACDVASSARSIADVLVATDDERVLETARRAGFRAEMTGAGHASGTDRIASVAARLDADVVVGLQADEPFLAFRDIDTLVEGLAGESGGARLATLAAPLGGRDRWLDPNTVKVVTDPDGNALYFSRAPIPFYRQAGHALSFPPDGEPPECARCHVGVYAWRRDALVEFASLPPSLLERCESLEQLRALEAGFKIRVFDATGQPFGVDTPEDLREAERRLARTSGAE